MRGRDWAPAWPGVRGCPSWGRAHPPAAVPAGPVSKVAAHGGGGGTGFQVWYARRAGWEKPQGAPVERGGRPWLPGTGFSTEVQSGTCSPGPGPGTGRTLPCPDVQAPRSEEPGPVKVKVTAAVHGLVALGSVAAPALLPAWVLPSSCLPPPSTA